jgi:hypothetical protein
MTNGEAGTAGKTVLSALLPTLGALAMGGGI